MSNTYDNLTPEELAEKLNHGELIVEPKHEEVCSFPTPANSPAMVQTVESVVPPDQLNMAAQEPAAPTTFPRFDGMDIANPFELLLLLDDNILSGKTKLHKWQMQFMMDFSEEHMDSNPFQAVVRACNGSGKDKYIIAPCAVWLCMRFQKARCVVTSSSGVQLDNQTEQYIRMLCVKANQLFGDIWKVNYRYYECLATGSPIILYATDEAGKAEGYHPFDTDAKMALFESEAKTVADDIDIAMSKCTGYTHRVLVSTPGLPMGHFYNYCSTAINRSGLKNSLDVGPTDWIQYHVTAYDCSHIKPNDIERGKRDLPGGETGSAFQSQYLAEFGTTDEETVIPFSHVWSLSRAAVRYNPSDLNIAGLDLSRGGDETVLSVRNGNKLLAVIPFRFDDTEDTVRFLEQKFKEHSLVNSKAYIWADAGGLGAPVIDRLRGLGWTNVKYVNNQGSPHDKRIYKNRGAEMWWNLGKLIERKEIILINDRTLYNQLATRYYKKVQGSQHTLESKEQARAHGRPSPDRADSVVLCFSDFVSSGFPPQDTDKYPFEHETPVKVEPDFSLKERIADEQKHDKFKKPQFQTDFSAMKDEIDDYNMSIRLGR